jgi:tRNA1(Val) A37 N6-methylase TrmN6
VSGLASWAGAIQIRSVELIESHFKGWAKPGPQPPGLAAGVVLETAETLDAVAGRFRLFQLRDGHRFSTDDVLTAWYGTSWCPTAQTALDLGSGIGTVGTVVAWRLPGARLVTVEAQEVSVALARKSVRYNGLEARYEIRLGDFRDPGVLRADEHFDLITGSPPYFPPGTGVESEHPQKLACRFELRGTVADYCATAAKHLAPGGFFACVFPNEAAQLARVEAGAREAGLVIVRRRPVVFREGDPALIGLFGLMRATDLPEWFRGQTWVEPDLIIRTREGKIHPEYSAVKLAIGFPP